MLYMTSVASMAVAIAIDKCQFSQQGYFDNNITYHRFNTSSSPLSAIKNLDITFNNDLKPSQIVCNMTIRWLMCVIIS